MKKVQEHAHHFTARIFVRLFLGLFFILALYLINIYSSQHAIAYYLLGILIVSSLLDVFDHRYALLPGYLKHENEHKNHFSVRTFFLLGSLIVLAYFDVKIAFAAISMNILGTVGGQLFRKYPLNLKNFPGAIQGFLLGFILNVIGGLFFLNAAIIIIPMAIVGGLIESFATRDEDSLLVPILTATTAQIIVILLQSM